MECRLRTRSGGGPGGRIPGTDSVRRGLGGIRIAGTNCSINGVRVNNARLIIQINEADLLAAENGDYEGFLTVTHTGGIAMGQSKTRNNLRISLTKITTIIQIRKLNTVDLGTWDTVAAFMDDRERYCVYSRNPVVLATRGHPQLAVCYNPGENRLNVSGGLISISSRGSDGANESRSSDN